MRKFMLKNKQESAGLGSPPDPYYTNDIESKNRVLKHQNSYKPHQLPDFVKSMKSLYMYEARTDKAVVGIGEYALRIPYSSHGVQAKDWFKKNQKQRERILDHFSKAKLSSAVYDTSTQVTDERDPFTDGGINSHVDKTYSVCVL